MWRMNLSVAHAVHIQQAGRSFFFLFFFYSLLANVRGVYWQQPGNTIHIPMYVSQYDTHHNLNIKTVPEHFFHFLKTLWKWLKCMQRGTENDSLNLILLVLQQYNLFILLDFVNQLLFCHPYKIKLQK